MTGITAGRSRNVTLREVNKVKWITITGIFMGMNIALCAFGIPVPGGHLYLNDVLICTASLLLDPVGAFQEPVPSSPQTGRWDQPCGRCRDHGYPLYPGQDICIQHL